VPGLIAGIARSLKTVLANYQITTPLLVAHVMAQISHECGAGRDVVENLNYKAARMMQVWPKRFPTLSSAAPYAGNPRALANKVYNGRMGNAQNSDDGWIFRGRGAAQTTGREGYQRLAKVTGLDVVGDPDLVLSPEHFLECGADFINCG
jgi:putative chitinase